MLGPFVEAVRATAQPCTFLLIAPMAIAVVCARARWSALLAAVGAAIVGGWLLAANWFLLDGALLAVSAIVGIVLLGAIAIPRVGRRRPIVAQDRSRAAIVGAVTLVATMWWRPCVGSELGSILTASQDGVPGQLFPMALYMIGASVPVVAIALAYAAVEPPERYADALSWAAYAGAIVLAGSLVLGQHDQVVVALTRWTTG